MFNPLRTTRTHCVLEEMVHTVGRRMENESAEDVYYYKVNLNRTSYVLKQFDLGNYSILILYKFIKPQTSRLHSVFGRV